MKSNYFDFIPYLFIFIFYFWPRHTACEILIPWPGIEPVPPAVEAHRALTTGLPGKSP